MFLCEHASAFLPAELSVVTAALLHARLYFDNVHNALQSVSYRTQSLVIVMLSFLVLPVATMLCAGY